MEVGRVSTTGKSISVPCSCHACRACERARRGKAAWASERRFDSGARAIWWKKSPPSSSCCGNCVLGCPQVVRVRGLNEKQ